MPAKKCKRGTSKKLKEVRALRGSFSKANSHSRRRKK
jgi:hypothetical protein